MPEAGPADPEDVLGELGFSRLRVDGKALSVSPPIEGLPPRMAVPELLGELDPVSRAYLKEAIRRARGEGGWIDVSFCIANVCLAARLKAVGSLIEGVIWRDQGVPPAPNLVRGLATQAGLIGGDGRIELASEASLIGQDSGALDPHASVSIEEAVRGARVGQPVTLSLIERLADRERYWRLVLDPLPGGQTVYTKIDETARQMASDRADRSVRELNHRVRNAMSVVTALVSLSAPHAKDVGEFASATLARIGALDVAYSMTGTNPLEPHRYQTEVSLEDLTHKIVGLDPAITVESTRLKITPGQATAIGLILHELTTNARRHGALSGSRGQLDVRFRGTGSRFGIVWTETGSTAPKEPDERFGLSIIRSFAANYLNGGIDWRATQDGVVVEIEVAGD